MIVPAKPSEALLPLAARLRRRAPELAAYGRACYRPQPQRRFVIFAQGRTGSWLLHDFLNTHPDISCDKEVLDRPVVSPHWFIRGLAASASASLYGFHAQLRHLRDVQGLHPGRYLGDLHRRGWKIIHLRRDNYLRQSVSAMIAVKRGRWTEAVDSPRQTIKSHIDPAELWSWLERRESSRVAEQAALAGLPHLELVYERDLLRPACHQQTMDRVFDYLEISPCEITANLRRISGDDLAGCIENFDEVSALLRGSRFAHFLES